MRVGEETDPRGGGQHNAPWRGHWAESYCTQASPDSPCEPHLQAAHWTVPWPAPVQPCGDWLGHQGRHREPADEAQPVQGLPQSSRSQEAGAGTWAGHQDAEPVHWWNWGDCNAPQHASQLLLTTSLQLCTLVSLSKCKKNIRLETETFQLPISATLQWIYCCSNSCFCHNNLLLLQLV